MNFPKPTREQRLEEKIARLKAKKKEPRLSDYKKVVQRKFNTYIRERDKGQPCLACGKHSDNMQASHYIAQGSAGALRYNAENVHSTCVSCNMYKHGNLIEMRIGLVKKIGEDRVKLLEEHRHDLHKWTKEELDLIVMALSWT